MHDRPRILIVDDDAGIAQLLRGYLSGFAMDADFAADGEQMRIQMRQHDYQLLVLDVMLPGEDGFALAREVQGISRIPIIMLTARSAAQDRVAGLELGADDYIGKPFEPRELVARIHTVLRRTQPPAPGLYPYQGDGRISFDGWRLDHVTCQLTSPDGLHVALSQAECRLLVAFLQAPRRLCSRDYLMNRARGRAMDMMDRGIDLLVSRLRQKLVTANGRGALIRTVRGGGYLFDARDVQGASGWRH